MLTPENIAPIGEIGLKHRASFPVGGGIAYVFTDETPEAAGVMVWDPDPANPASEPVVMLPVRGTKGFLHNLQAVCDAIVKSREQKPQIITRPSILRN